ncbi:hypothetical protein V6N13_083211 [Hibiscus sabdariffa]
MCADVMLKVDAKVNVATKFEGRGADGPNSEIPRANKAITTIRAKIGEEGERTTRNNQPQSVSNASLFDSDFLNHKRVILKEASLTLDLGKLIVAETIRNKDQIVKDIARIIEARVKKR